MKPTRTVLLSDGFTMKFWDRPRRIKVICNRGRERVTLTQRRTDDAVAWLMGLKAKAWTVGAILEETAYHA